MEYSLREVKRIAFGHLAVVDCINLYPLSKALLRVEKGLGLEMGAESGGGSELEG